MQQQQQPTPFMEALNDAVTRFQAIRVNDLSDRYIKWPNEQNSKLGSGSYGEAFRVRAVDADRTREPERVAKVIPKSRIARNATQVQHLCAELAVSGILNHHNLNHRVGLFHNDTHIFVILELCGGPRPDLTTRLAHLFAYRRPSRFPEIDKIISDWSNLATQQGVDPSDQKALGDFVDSQGLMKSLAAECGVNLTRDNPELPVANDLFNFIVAYRRISDPFAQIIIRQVLQGVEFLHANQIVHRDMKTENVVVGVIRKAVLKRDENGVCVGATFFEKVDCKVIDFGLVKYMNIGNAAVVSPGAYIRATGAEQEQEAAKKKEKNDDDDDDEEEEEDEQAKLAQQWGAAQNNVAPIQRPPEAGSANAFDPVAVTPCGTEIYCSLEALTGILNAGLGQARAKWSSSKQTLPKMDVFGVGAILYCLSNGKPPFRPPETYRRISREERMRQIERLVAAGPIFINAASQASRAMTLRLMDNDVSRRYTSSQALLDPFVQHNSDVVVTESTLEGIVAIRLGQSQEWVAVAAPSLSSGAGEDAATSQEPSNVIVSAVTGATIGTSTNTANTANNNTGSQQQVGEDDDGTPEKSNTNNNDQQQQQQEETDEETAAALNDVMEALRNREDDGDAAGKDDTDNDDNNNKNEEDAAQK